MLWGIAFEIAFAAAVVYLPPLQSVFGTASLRALEVAPLAAFPISCGAPTRSGAGRSGGDQNQHNPKPVTTTRLRQAKGRLVNPLLLGENPG
ncbi:MAG: hypothetical protein ACXVWT_27725 [Solirubrobacteraceae bacterium]